MIYQAKQSIFWAAIFIYIILGAKRLNNSAAVSLPKLRVDVTKFFSGVIGFSSLNLSWNYLQSHPSLVSGTCSETKKCTTVDFS